MASELSRFIDEELLKEGKEGELAKLLAKQTSQRSKARRPAFSGFCTLRGICCLLIFGVVAAAVIATARQKDAPKKVIGWARSKGRAPTNELTPEDPGQPPFPGKEVGQANVAAVGQDEQQRGGATPADAGPEQPAASATQQHADVSRQPEPVAPAPAPHVAPAPAAHPFALAPGPVPAVVVPASQSAGQEPAAAVPAPEAPADAMPGPQQGPAAAAVNRPFAAAPEPAAGPAQAPQPHTAAKQAAAVPAPAPQPEADAAAQQGGGVNEAPAPLPAEEAPLLDRAHKARQRSSGSAGRKLLALGH